MRVVLVLPGVELTSVGLAVEVFCLLLKVTIKQEHTLDALQRCGEVIVLLIPLISIKYGV